MHTASFIDDTDFAYVTVIIRDKERIIERILNLVPHLLHDVYVQVKYLTRVTTFSGKY